MHSFFLELLLVRVTCHSSIKVKAQDDKSPPLSPSAPSMAHQLHVCSANAPGHRILTSSTHLFTSAQITLHSRTSCVCASCLGTTSLFVLASNEHFPRSQTAGTHVLSLLELLQTKTVGQISSIDTSNFSYSPAPCLKP